MSLVFVYRGSNSANCRKWMEGGEADYIASARIHVCVCFETLEMIESFIITVNQH